MVAATYSKTLSSEDCVQLLIESGCDINLYDNKKRTALHHAIINNMISSTIKTIELLIIAQANVNQKDHNNMIPLLYIPNCCINEIQEKIIKLLIKAGSDINSYDKQKQTLLHKIILIE